MRLKREKKSEPNVLIRITDNLSEKIVKFCSLIEEDPYTDFSVIIEKMNLFTSYLLDDELGLTFNNLVEGRQDLLCIKNLPVSSAPLPDTPLRDEISLKKDFISEKVILGLSTKLNAIPKINTNEKNGDIIQQVIPIPGKELQLSGLGSKLAFDFHTENIHETDPPSYFMLFCLKGDQHATTTYIHVDTILENLPYWMVKELIQENYIAKTGPSYNRTLSRRTSILKRNKMGDLEINFNMNTSRCFGISDYHDTILSKLRNHINSIPKEGIVLNSGDCLIINNKKLLHGRTAFDISTSIEDRRWLQRVYLYKR